MPEITTTTDVRYEHFTAWTDGGRLVAHLRRLLDESSAKTICDIGGGANPHLTLDDVESRGLDYTILDISQTELDKAPGGYKKVRRDITVPDPDAVAEFDFVFSVMLAEHVKDPAQFHRNVLAMLNPGGLAVHLMPTLYEPAFVVNRLMPEAAGRRVLRVLQPHRKLDTTQAKFPAYYRWCRGPSERHLDRFRALGYEVQEARGYFGTSYLGSSLPGRLYDRISRALVRRPVPALCSFTLLVLRKP